MNELVRAMARQQQASIAEIYGAFVEQPSLEALFADRVHPNDAGYQVIARSFLDAITRPYPTSTSSAGSRLLLEPR